MILYYVFFFYIDIFKLQSMPTTWSYYPVTVHCDDVKKTWDDVNIRVHAQSLKLFSYI